MSRFISTRIIACPVNQTDLSANNNQSALICSYFNLLGNHLFDHGIGQLEPGGLGVIQPGLEGIADLHQLIDFGDDTVLFATRWQCDWQHI